MIGSDNIAYVRKLVKGVFFIYLFNILSKLVYLFEELLERYIHK